MTADPFLRRLHDALSPRDGAQARVAEDMWGKMPKTGDLKAFKASLAPPPGAKERVWARVSAKTAASPAATALDVLRDYLSPAAGRRESVGMAVVARPRRDSWNVRFVKWTAAFALFALIIQGLPPLFLAPRTVAESEVLIVPTRGSVSIDSEGLWQPISKQMSLKTAAAFDTGGGEATMILNDDGNIRLGELTRATLHDVINRPEPTTAESTISLEQGDAWAQAFVPPHLRPIVIRTPQAFVQLHEGSASIEVGGETTRVKVWDRHATVRSGDRELILVAGEWTEVRADNEPMVKYLDAAEYDDAWVAQNLKRDAVHRREIAQRQHERAVAQAGILPTSRFYPVKRAVEEMDVLLTFDSQSRVEKRLDQASTRLNEATALIAEGNTDISVPLEEFRSTMLEIAAGTGGDVVTTTLIRHRVEESTAQLAALKPDDESYAVKVAVLEASAELPLDVVKPREVEAVLLADAVATAEKAAEAGDKERAAELLEEIEPRIAAARGEELPPEVRKDMESALRQLTAALDEPAEEPAAQPQPAVAVVPKRVPAAERPPRVEAVRRLSADELGELIEGAVSRVGNVDAARSKWNQLQLEIRNAREDYPADMGMILRQLHIAFRNDPALDSAILEEIRKLRGQ